MSAFSIGLSTRWNAWRHKSGEAMVEEIRQLGFDRIELGYDLRWDLVDGVRKCVEGKLIAVDSVHNYCPVPLGAPRGSPELFSLSATDGRERSSAVRHTVRTVEFAAELGARFVVIHAGRVDMGDFTSRLVRLWERGGADGDRYARLKMKLLLMRERRARRHLEALVASLDEILASISETRIGLALELLPTWEALPTELELKDILARYPAERVWYWHDAGHAQVRENLGFISLRHWLETLADRLAGMHVHDVAPPAADHLMPPLGNVDFDMVGSVLRPGTVVVLEPSPEISAQDVTGARAFLDVRWSESSVRGTWAGGAAAN